MTTTPLTSTEDTTETIGDVVNEEWAEHLDVAVMALPIASACGADCAAVIRKGDELIQLLADRDSETHEAIRAAVGAQCSTYYFG